MGKNRIMDLVPPGTLDYNGLYKDKQVHGNSHHGKRYQKIEYSILNNYQNFLYNRALFGLSVYSQEEIKEMHWDKRKRVIKVHKRAQKILNVWKQEIVNKKVTNFFDNMFPNSRIFDSLCEDFTDTSFRNTLSFKDLGLKKEDVIYKLMQEGILPKEFFELKPVNDAG